MFAESLLESSGGLKTSQGWTTLVSLSLEGIVIGLLVLVPLLENQALPRMLWTVTTPVAPPPRGVLHPAHSGGGGRSSDAIHLVLTPPRTIPTSIDWTPDGTGSNPEGTGPDMPLGVPWGVERSVGPVLPAPTDAALPPTAPVSRPVSIVTEGNVTYKVLPVYPPIAKQIGAQGPVVLRAAISKDGMVESLRVVSSAHPLLSEAALDAVRQWRFRPYLLNGFAVEVEAQITVNFIMPR
ncbi:MAG: energy transducer TonB [Terriglobales bacterium]